MGRDLNVQKQAFIDYLIKEKGIPAEKLDLNGDGDPSFEEAVTYALISDNWEEHLTKLDSIGVKHPLDKRNYDPKIKERIAKLAEDAVSITKESGVSPDDSGFCHALHTNFFKLGGSTFEKGGLCLAYPDWYKQIWNFATEVEMTSKESFDVCLNMPKESLGSCTEHGYMQMGAVRVAAETQPVFEKCPIDYMATENHVYTAGAGGESYDASKIGEIGWSAKVNPAASYYSSLAHMGGVTSLFEKAAGLFGYSLEKGMTSSSYEKIANLIAPTLFVDPAVKEYIADENYAKALDSLDKIVSAHPKMINTFLRTIPYYESMLPKKEAEKFAFMVLKRWPENPYSFIAVGGLKHFLESKAYFARRLQEKFPSSGYGEFILGTVYAENSNFNDALDMYNNSLNINPNNPYSLQAKAGILFNQGKFEEAKGLIDKAIEIAPNINGNHMLLANIKIMAGDMPAALEESGKEAIVFWDNPIAYFLNAQISLNMGKPLEAGDMAERYLQNLNSYPSQLLKRFQSFIANALNVKFFSCQTMGDYNCMLKSASDILYLDNFLELKRSIMAQLSLAEYDPDSVLSIAGTMDQNTITTKQLKFLAYLLKYDLASAGTVLEEIKIAMPDSPLALQLDGMLELQKGNLRRAAELFEEIASKNEHDWQSRFYLVSMYHYFAGGNEARAKELIGDMVSRFPDIATIRTLHADMLYDNGSTNEAVDIAFENLNANPFDLEAAFLLARAALDGNLESSLQPPEDIAIEMGEKLSRSQPHNFAGAYILARAYLKLGRYEEALQYAEVAKEKWLESPLKPVIFQDVETLPETIRKEVKKTTCHSRESGNL